MVIQWDYTCHKWAHVLVAGSWCHQTAICERAKAGSISGQNERPGKIPGRACLAPERFRRNMWGTTGNHEKQVEIPFGKLSNSYGKWVIDSRFICEINIDFHGFFP